MRKSAESQTSNMASSSSNEDKSSKRKVDNNEADESAVKAAKASDPITDIVAAANIKCVQAWKQVAAKLDEANVPKCDKYDYDSMKWMEKEENDYVELTLSMGYDTNSRDLYTRYTICYPCDGRIRSLSYVDKEWDDLITQLKQRIVKLRSDVARAKIMLHLKSELESWKELLDSIPDDKITTFPEASFDDGRLVLEWRPEDAKGVDFIRLDRGYEEEDQPLGHEVSFRITTPSTDDPRICIRIHKVLCEDAIDKVARLLKGNRNDD